MSKEVSDALKSLEGYEEAQGVLARTWKWAYTTGFQKERRKWAEGIRRGKLFRDYHGRFEVCSPRTRFALFFSCGTTRFFEQLPCVI